MGRCRSGSVREADRHRVSAGRRKVHGEVHEPVRTHIDSAVDAADLSAAHRRDESLVALTYAGTSLTCDSAVPMGLLCEFLNGFGKVQHSECEVRCGWITGCRSVSCELCGFLSRFSSSEIGHSVSQRRYWPSLVTLIPVRSGLRESRAHRGCSRWQCRYDHRSDKCSAVARTATGPDRIGQTDRRLGSHRERHNAAASEFCGGRSVRSSPLLDLRRRQRLAAQAWKLRSRGSDRRCEWLLLQQRPRWGLRLLDAS